MDLKEALNAVKEMGKFFDGFRTIETIIEAASGLEQEINDLETQKAQAASEVKSLESRKEKLEELIVEAGNRVKAIKSEMVSEASAARAAFEAEKQTIAEETIELKKAKQKALTKHTNAMKRIDDETAAAEKVLADVKRNIEKIKEKL